MPILRLAGKAPRRRRPVNSALGSAMDSTSMFPELSAADLAELTRLEEAMWREATRFDLSFQEAHFSPDFMEFGRSGRTYERRQIIRTDGAGIHAKLPLANLSLRQLDVNTVLITYNSEVAGEVVTEFARRSSIWSRTPQGWVMRFHQGTPYVPEKPGSASNIESAA